MKDSGKMEKLIKYQNGKMENNGNGTELKDENRDEDKDKRNYGIAISAYATQLILYDLGVNRLSTGHCGGVVCPLFIYEIFTET